jgi:hypothetical protein
MQFVALLASSDCGVNKNPCYIFVPFAVAAVAVKKIFCLADSMCDLPVGRYHFESNG